MKNRIEYQVYCQINIFDEVKMFLKLKFFGYFSKISLFYFKWLFHLIFFKWKILNPKENRTYFPMPGECATGTPFFLTRMKKKHKPFLLKNKISQIFVKFLFIFFSKMYCKFHWQIILIYSESYNRNTYEYVFLFSLTVIFIVV